MEQNIKYWEKVATMYGLQCVRCDKEGNTIGAKFWALLCYMTCVENGIPLKEVSK